MKFKQSALAILLSLVMVLTFMPVMASADEDDSYDFGELPEASEMSDIELDEEVTVTVTNEKPIATYVFVPETSG